MLNQHLSQHLNYELNHELNHELILGLNLNHKQYPNRALLILGLNSNRRGRSLPELRQKLKACSVPRPANLLMA